MKKTVTLLTVLLISCMALPPLVSAVSWSPLEEEREPQTAKGVMSKGAVVCLFQSGTADVRKAIAAGDTLVVYRKNGAGELTAVGKIKVLSYAGSDYLNGEVLEGEIKAGDVAKKGDVASVVLSPGTSCQ